MSKVSGVPRQQLRSSPSHTLNVSFYSSHISSFSQASVSKVSSFGYSSALLAIFVVQLNYTTVFDVCCRTSSVPDKYMNFLSFKLDSELVLTIAATSC